MADHLVIPPRRVQRWAGNSLALVFNWRYVLHVIPEGRGLAHTLSYNYLFVRFDPKVTGWFGVDRTRYDGHTSTSVTVAGVEVGFGYTYEIQELR
jgi:hypothetical protein